MTETSNFVIVEHFEEDEIFEKVRYDNKIILLIVSNVISNFPKLVFSSVFLVVVIIIVSMVCRLGKPTDYFYCSNNYMYVWFLPFLGGSLV